MSDDSDGSDHAIVQNSSNACDPYATDCCDKSCKVGKEKEISNFLASAALMSKREKQTCMTTCLSLLWKSKTEPSEATQGKKTRVRFTYRVPLVGDVCRATFAECFGVSSPTIDRCRQRIAQGLVAAKEHGNQKNKNAHVINIQKVVEWFEAFAKQVGEVVPVRVRTKTTLDGAVIKQVASKLYTFLPSYMTWQSILNEYEQFVAAGLERIRLQSERSFRRIVQRECKSILVRSPQANVCDACTVYKNTMSDAKDAEVFALHVQTASKANEV
ncbi:hypothetical protein Ae201684P_005874 [Aphanomyces euteiches]|nr:hypothetical protein Ae201684P_005874 [Aphanomyces euteiches]